MGQQQFYVPFFYTAILISLGLPYGQGQTTHRLLLPSERTPVLTTLGYTVDVSKPLSQTAVEVDDLACGSRHLCNDTKGNYLNSHCYDCPLKCMCDDTCRVYGDCCADLAFEDVGTQKSLARNIECVHKLPKNNKGLASIGLDHIFMFAKCPEDATANEESVRRCEHANISDYIEATPVTDITNNFVYRNVFCAQCLGVVKYKAWTYKIECEVGSSAVTASSKDELWRLVLDDSKCTVINSPPENASSSLRYCLDGNIVNSCNVSGLWRERNDVVETLCAEYYHPVQYQDDGVKYRNVFCAMCNGAVVDRRKQCFVSRTFNVVPRMRPKPISQPLSVLIDFSSEPEENPPIISQSSLLENNCSEGEVFEPLSDTCAPLRCSQRRILVGGRCEPVYRSSQGLGYSLSHVMEPPPGLYANVTGSVATAYQERLRDSLADFKPVAFTFVLVEPYIRSRSAIGDQNQLAGIHVSVNLVSSADKTVESMEQALRRLEEMATEVDVGSSRVSLTTRSVSCPASEPLFMEGKRIEEESVYLLSPPSFPNCFDGSCTAGVQYLPVNGILDCPYVEINLTETNATFIEQNFTIWVNNQSVVVNISNHYYCGEILRLCESVVYELQELLQASNDTFIVPIPGDGDIAMTILSIICISLSLLCLLITFIVYCIVPPLRTLPGKNTMALIVHLFFAQLIFQIGIQLNYNVPLCRAMGVLIHYFWLTAFAWMAVSAYHMCAVFSNLASSRFSTRSDVIKTLLKYAVLCNVYALVFILICVVYHLVSTQGADMGYGGDICFLNKPRDIGIFFALPLGLVLVFNAVCFIRTVLSIRNVPNMNRSKTKPDRNHMHVYFRLSILLGFTWIFGFVAAIFREDALWYIFIILNGLQGVFIFVAYCLNGRTIRLIQSALNQKAGIKYSRPSKTTSTDKTTHSTSI